MSRATTSIAPQIIDEASDWFVLMREPSVSAQERERFSEWLRASPVHVGTYLEITRLWSDVTHIDPSLDLGSGAGELDNVVQLREGPSVSVGEFAGEHQSDVPREAHRAVPSAKRPFLLAASVLMCVIASGVWWYANRAQTYATDIGEQRTVTLEDGSIVKLNSSSRFTVRMSPERRQIDLVSGQALFEVAHETARPFIVKSGEVAVRAVGTQFDVNQRRSGTIVTVIEGRVKVDAVPSVGLSRLFTPSTPVPAELQQEPSRPTSGARPEQSRGSAPNVSLSASAGEQVRVAQNGAMERTTTANAEAAISWLQHELRFDDQPLSDVVEEFNRYARTPIVLVDPSLENLRINAVFHTTNPDSLLRFVSRFDGVRVEKTQKEIRIDKRK